MAQRGLRRSLARSRNRGGAQLHRPNHAVAAATGARVVELNHVEMRGKAVALRSALRRRVRGANAFLVVDADSVASPNLIAPRR